MNWEAIGAIGEIVGATAVVLTLLFLTMQLRQNTKAVDESRKATVSQLYQFRANMHMDGMLRKAESTGYNELELLLKARTEGLSSLTSVEFEFIKTHQIANAVRLDNGLFQHRNGFLDDDYVEYIERVIAALYPTWVELDIFEMGFRSGFVEDAKKIWEKRNST
jgi:hypothetical protein